MNATSIVSGFAITVFIRTGFYGNMDVNFFTGTRTVPPCFQNLKDGTFKGSNHLNIIRKLKALAYKLTDRYTCFLFITLLVRVESPLCDEMN